jgi:hypothetical protein
LFVGFSCLLGLGFRSTGPKLRFEGFIRFSVLIVVFACDDFLGATSDRLRTLLSLLYTFLNSLNPLLH